MTGTKQHEYFQDAAVAGYWLERDISDATGMARTNLPLRTLEQKGVIQRNKLPCKPKNYPETTYREYRRKNRLKTHKKLYFCRLARNKKILDQLNKYFLKNDESFKIINSDYLQDTTATVQDYHYLEPEMVVIAEHGVATKFARTINPQFGRQNTSLPEDLYVLALPEQFARYLNGDETYQPEFKELRKAFPSDDEFLYFILASGLQRGLLKTIENGARDSRAYRHFEAGLKTTYALLHKRNTHTLGAKNKKEVAIRKQKPAKKLQAL